MIGNQRTMALFATMVLFSPWTVWAAERSARFSATDDDGVFWGLVMQADGTAQVWSRHNTIVVMAADIRRTLQVSDQQILDLIDAIRVTGFLDLALVQLDQQLVHDRGFIWHSDRASLNVTAEIGLVSINQSLGDLEGKLEQFPDIEAKRICDAARRILAGSLRDLVAATVPDGSESP